MYSDIEQHYQAIAQRTYSKIEQCELIMGWTLSDLGVTHPSELNYMDHSPQLSQYSICEKTAADAQVEFNKAINLLAKFRG